MLEKFISSIKQMANFLNIDVVNVERFHYLQLTEDFDGLTKEEIKENGGFSTLKRLVIQSMSEPEENATPAEIGEEDNEAMIQLRRFVKNNGYLPTKKGISKTCLFTLAKTSYGSMDDLITEYKSNYSDELAKYTVTEDVWTPEYIERVNKDIKKYKKFIITSAASTCDIHEGFMSALTSYAKKNKALILVLPLHRPKRDSVNTFVLDKKLFNYNVRTIFGEVSINSNLKVNGFKTSLTVKKPFAGLESNTAVSHASLISPGAFQKLMYIPTMQDKTPMSLSCPGRCTTAKLPPKREDRTNVLGKAEVRYEKDSTLGALIVEVNDDNIFHIRNIEAVADGSFIDKAIEYKPDGSTANVINNVLIMGDLHAPQHNDELLKYNLEVAKTLNATKIVLHDGVNMAWVSHHNDNNLYAKARLVQNGNYTLESEAESFLDILQEISKLKNIQEIIIPASNHPQHLDRYIAEGKYVKDPINHATAAKIFVKQQEIGKGKEAVPTLIEDVLGYKNDKVTFLKRDEGYNIYGIEVGLHGSDGANGGRASTTTFNNAFSKSITAHKHAACIDGNAIVVGVACNKEQGYNHGLSSWTESSAIVYPNGTAQLLTFLKVKGEYKSWL